MALVIKIVADFGTSIHAALVTGPNTPISILLSVGVFFVFCFAVTYF